MFRKATRAPHRFVPALEAFEDRLVPASVLLNNGVLNIVGSAGVDSIFITDNGDGEVIVLSSDPNGNLVRNGAARVDSIVVTTKGGKDNVSYDQTGDRKRSMDLQVNLGSEADGFNGDLHGDILNFRMMQIKVDGGSGRDVMGLHADNDVDVQGLALLKMELNGGDDNDTILALYQGKADGELRLNARGQDGNDLIAAVVTADAGSEGRLGAGGQQATVEGNNGNDTLTFRVLNQTSPGFEVFAKIDGGRNGFLFGLFGGKDTGRHTANVSVTGIEKDILVP
jgi:hypothetical protein